MSESAPPFIDIMLTVFPVFATEDEPTKLARPDSFGTAFAVAPGVFLTAAHVLAEALKHGKPALAGPTSRGPMGSALIDKYEMFPDRDVALLFSEARGTLLNTWLVNHLQVLTDVSSFGYPHAVTRDNDREHFEVVFRAYKGYVITTRGFQRLAGKPAVYEVSLPFPVGLSGAPVLLEKDGRLVVVGIVLGEDTVEYGGVAQKVGIAMTAKEIVELHSKELGGPIAARLEFNGVTIGPVGP